MVKSTHPNYNITTHYSFTLQHFNKCNWPQYRVRQGEGYQHSICIRRYCATIYVAMNVVVVVKVWLLLLLFFVSEIKQDPLKLVLWFTLEFLKNWGLICIWRLCFSNKQSLTENVLISYLQWDIHLGNCKKKNAQTILTSVKTVLSNVFLVMKNL